MSLEKTTAIVLRSVDFSESSCVITLMTQDFGKITALAKGARRRKNPFEGALDLLSVSRIVFLHKKSESLDLLTESKLERRFRSAAQDLNRFYAGLYVAELLSAMTDENDPHPDLFELATDVIEQIDNGTKTTEQLFRFEIGALILLGHKPMLERCVDCGREKSTADKRVNLGLNAGGIYCKECRKGKTNIVSLSAQAWHCLLKLSQLPKRPEIDQRLFAELRQVLNRYITHHLGYRPRLHKFIN